MAMKTPGVYIVEKNAFPNSVVQVATAVPAFIGYTEKAANGTVSLHMVPRRITSLSEFHQYFGIGHKAEFTLGDYVPGIGDKPPLSPKGKAGDPLLPRAIFTANGAKKELTEAGAKAFTMYAAMRMFFQNGGGACYIVSIGSYDDEISDEPMTKALELLKKEAEPTMIVIPETTRLSRGKAAAVQQAALYHCGVEMKSRFAILDMFAGHLPQGAEEGNPVAEFRNDIGTNQLNYGATYYPWVKASLYDGNDFSYKNIAPASLNAFIAMLKTSLGDGSGMDKAIGLVGAPEVNGGFTIPVAPGGTTTITPAMLTATLRLPAPAAAGDSGAKYKYVVAPDAPGPGKFIVTPDSGTAAEAKEFHQEDVKGGKVAFQHDATSSETEVVLAVEDSEGNSTGNITVALDLVSAVVAKPADGATPVAVEFDAFAGIDAATDDDKKTLKIKGAATAADTVTVTDIGVWGTTDDGKVTFAPADNFAGPEAVIEYEYKLGTDDQSGKARISFEGTQPPKRLGSPQADLIDKTLRANVPLYKEIMDTLAAYANTMPPSGAMAGLYTMVDNTRGVWKAPANVSVGGVDAPMVNINHEEQENLNVSTTGKSINAIRPFVGEGTLVWGARTLDGNSLDWRYINVRRTMIMLEESIRLAAKAYVFEPNTSQTWITMKSMIENFLTGIWKQGGLAGTSPGDAFSVHVGLGDTMTAEDILEGILRITVLVAVTRPAEFIEITFQQQMQKS